MSIAEPAVTPVHAFADRAWEQFLELNPVWATVQTAEVVREAGEGLLVPADDEAVWQVVQHYAPIENLAPHDLRRTFAKLAHRSFERPVGPQVGPGAEPAARTGDDQRANRPAP